LPAELAKLGFAEAKSRERLVSGRCKNLSNEWLMQAWVGTIFPVLIFCKSV